MGDEGVILHDMQIARGDDIVAQYNLVLGRRQRTCGLRDHMQCAKEHAQQTKNKSASPKHWRLEMPLAKAMRLRELWRNANRLVNYDTWAKFSDDGRLRSGGKAAIPIRKLSTDAIT